jgi:hypothetical protein
MTLVRPYKRPKKTYKVKKLTKKRAEQLKKMILSYPRQCEEFNLQTRWVHEYPAFRFDDMQTFLALRYEERLSMRELSDALKYAGAGKVTVEVGSEWKQRWLLVNEAVKRAASGVTEIRF